MIIHALTHGSSVTGSEEKVRVCRDTGAHLSINYKEKNFAEEVLSFTGNKGIQNLMYCMHKYFIQK